MSRKRLLFIICLHMIDKLPPDDLLRFINITKKWETKR